MSGNGPWITLRSAIKPELGCSIWRDEYNGKVFYSLQFFKEYTTKSGETKQSGIINIGDSFVYDELKLEAIQTIRKLTAERADQVKANGPTHAPVQTIAAGLGGAAGGPVSFDDDDIPFSPCLI